MEPLGECLPTKSPRHGKVERMNLDRLSVEVWDIFCIRMLVLLTKGSSHEPPWRRSQTRDKWGFREFDDIRFRARCPAHQRLRVYLQAANSPQAPSVELSQQDTAGLFTYSVVVADNDREKSAETTVEEFRLTSAVEVKYCVEPRQGIALARNNVVENAGGRVPSLYRR